MTLAARSRSRIKVKNMGVPRQDCDLGTQVCVPEPSEDRWVCLPSSNPSGVVGDPCEYLNVCPPGSMCASAEALPGCTRAQGCCTPLCDTTEPPELECTIAGTECVPWYPEGKLPGPPDPVGLCSAAPGPAQDSSHPDHVRATLR